jgi:type II secretory pathway pseudopilin PulG
MWRDGVPWGFLLLIAVVILIGITVLAWLTWRRRRDERLADKTRIERTRAALRQQRDAVSDDILKLEDEVRAVGNEDALAHYRNATSTYAAIVAEFETRGPSHPRWKPTTPGTPGKDPAAVTAAIPAALGPEQLGGGCRPDRRNA